MSMTLPRGLAAGSLLSLFLLAPLAASAEPGSDHPALPRYPGAKMEHYDFKEFEESQLILSQPRLVGSDYKADKVLPVEGAVTYLHYEMPGSASAFQVFRNHQSALQRNGFKELFVCKRPCIDNNLDSLRGLLKARNLYLNFHEDVQYLAAQREGTYISLMTASSGSGPSARTVVFAFITEQGQLDTGKIAVQGYSPIAKALAAEGKVDLYGFYFDTGKAQLQPGSDKTLGELAQVLKDNPSLRLRLVGHTDNQGADEANRSLSEARARAVVAALGTQQGIDAGRLEAQGQGASQPVAPNVSEDGRARNRRVEVIVLAGAAAAPTGATPAPAMRSAKAARGDTTPTPAGSGSTSSRPSADEVIDKTQRGADTANRVVDTVRSLKGLFGR